MKPNYRRMLKALKSKPEIGEDFCPKEWSVYILRCCDDTFYTGMAKDVQARLERHNLGRGAAYTRSRRPAFLLYSKNGLTRFEALICEAKIKRLSRQQKEALIAAA